MMKNKNTFNLKMKRLFLTLSFAMMIMAVMAIPAKKGLWRTITLTDGTEVRARLCGDEHVHFWQTEDGRQFVENDNDLFVPVTGQELQKRALARRSMKTATRLKSPRRVSMGDRTHYTGKKKGIVILAQYTDVKFSSGNTLSKYKRIMNEEGYSEGSFKGSVADYFKAQSARQFELDFDVVGPYTMSNNQKYYGQNDADGNDMHAEQMIKEACQQADAEVNFADYDWDGDGEVDQVFVVYAGKGEADGGTANTIWPHMYSLKEGTGSAITLDGVVIDTYACSNEIDAYGAIEGIGCFCHEFSHCMGFPDFYDINYSGWFGMDDFDLMCSGSYNGGSFLPAGYTAHEKMMCGWQEPIVLGETDLSVTDMQPMSKHGDTYIIYNDGHPDEYFTIENRQLTGWDAGYPAKGLMITHVDFDKDIWQCNIPNTKITTSSDEYRYYNYPLNDHQRMTIVHADNTASVYNVTTDLYPYGKRDSLSAKSTPAATLYNANAKGTKTVDWAITNITQNSDGTMSFKYRSPKEQTNNPPTPSGDYVFYESFDQCNGTGGNDGKWNGNVAGKALTDADNVGWSHPTDKMYSGYQCAKFGTSSVLGVATTPRITLNGKGTLTFKAGAWDAAKDGTQLQVESENATITPSLFTISKGDWTDCTATIEASGDFYITFTPGLRFFLDEVKIVSNETTPTGIETVKTTAAPQTGNRIYTLDGRYMGTDRNTLPRGIYIIGGKKVVR